MPSSVVRAAVVGTLMALGAVAPAARAQLADTVWVRPGGPVPRLSTALAKVRRGGVVIVTAGRYAEPQVAVTRPVNIVGQGMPSFDGEGTHGILLVTADDVSIRGLQLGHVGGSDLEDRAVVRVQDARGCTIAGNRVTDAFWGIYLANVTGCEVRDNVLRASHRTETTSGNGIQLWSSRGVRITGNRVAGFRDGIYFEFVHDTDVRANVSEGNLRYGLHFMYSDDCRYDDNTFRANGSGVAVMYTKGVRLRGNRFEDNWGAAAYGLLLKEISDAQLEDNTFLRNTTGLVADGANRLRLDHNDFVENGWAVRLDASTGDGRITRNNFVANTFDLASNSADQSTVLAGNYWDAYRGYDLDRDGAGDVPFHPVRLFAVIVERHAPAILLLRSAFVTLLDDAERALPVITPSSLADARPAMRRIR